MLHQVLDLSSPCKATGGQNQNCSAEGFPRAWAADAFVEWIVWSFGYRLPGWCSTTYAYANGYGNSQPAEELRR